MKAVITVIGKDKIGIIAGVTSVLSENNINILDINQTILQDYFTMALVADLSTMQITFKELQEKLKHVGEKIGLSIRIQHEDIFNAMHKI
ncbi:ACT domain-containing protein [Clostridiaceae bacterium 35-E11]